MCNNFHFNFLNLISFQGTIEFNPEILSYVTSFSDNLAINFGETETSQGILTYSWYDGSLNGLSFENNFNLFSIQFNVIGNNTNSEVNFSNTPTILEVVDNNFNSLNPIYQNGLIQFTNTINIIEYPELSQSMLFATIKWTKTKSLGL